MKTISKYLLFVPFLFVGLVSAVLYWVLNVFNVHNWRPKYGIVSKRHPFLQFFDLMGVTLFCVCFYFIFKAELTTQIVSFNLVFLLKLILVSLLLLMVRDISKISNSGEWKEWALLNKIVKKFSDFQEHTIQNQDNY